MLWREKSAEWERIEGQAWIAGNLTIQITKVLNAEVAEKGDLEKTEGNPFERVMSSARDFFDLKSFPGLMRFTVLRLSSFLFDFFLGIQ